MFFDFKPSSKEPKYGPFENPPEGEWRRIKRKIYSPWWRAVHNMVAHPLLTIYRPLGEKLHEYTAKRMYEPNGKKPEKTDND